MEEQQPIQQPQAVINNQPPVQAKPPKKKSGAGKKVLLVLLVLIFVAGAAFAGYTYAINQAEKQYEENVADLQSQIDSLKAEAQKAVADAESAEVSKLVIKEWGVELDPTESAMLYRIETSAGNEIVYLTNTATQSIQGCKATSTTPTQGYNAAISRYKAKQDSTEIKAEYVTQIDDYYYYVSGSNGTCAESQADQAKETEQRTALVVSAKSVKASE